jgi:prevent-host-death family protein
MHQRAKPGPVVPRLHIVPAERLSSGFLTLRGLGSDQTLDFLYMLLYTSAMGRRYSIAEARAHLPSIVDEVEAGPPVEITRRGKPVAVVLSPDQYESLIQQRASFADAYRIFRTKYDVDRFGLEGEFADLRDRDPGRKVDI